MSAFEDLKLVRDYLDSRLVGWIGARTDTTTVTGRDAIVVARAIADKLHKTCGENCVIRARLSRALEDNSGLRDCNAVLTCDLEDFEENLEIAKRNNAAIGQLCLTYRQKISDLETKVTELTARQ
jgi:hypothetical protein